MANWQLTKGLQNLRAQVNEAFPDRDTTSDGTIGDKAHQAETSGHNPDDTAGSRPEWNGDDDANAEVRAWDMDSDLRAAPATAQQVVDHIRKLPGVSSVLRYMIYNRKIYQASNGWFPQVYSGASAHTEHIHFSGAYTQAADNNTGYNYRLEEIPVALTAADKSWLTSMVDTRIDAAEAKILAVVGHPIELDDKIGDKANPNRTVGDVLRDLAKLRGVLVGDQGDTANAGLAPASPLAKLIAAAGDVEEILGLVAAKP
jgi:hypothetical protein